MGTPFEPTRSAISKHNTRSPHALSAIKILLFRWWWGAATRHGHQIAVLRRSPSLKSLQRLNEQPQGYQCDNDSRHIYKQKNNDEKKATDVSRLMTTLRYELHFRRRTTTHFHFQFHGRYFSLLN